MGNYLYFRIVILNLIFNNLYWCNQYLQFKRGNPMKSILKQRHFIIILSIVVAILLAMLISSNRNYKELESHYINNSIITPLDHFSRTLSDIEFFLDEAITDGEVTSEELKLIEWSMNNAMLFLQDLEVNYSNMMGNEHKFDSSVVQYRIREARDNSTILYEKVLSHSDGQRDYVLNEEEINSLDSNKKFIANYSELFSEMLELIEEEGLNTKVDFEKSAEWKSLISDVQFIEAE